MAEGLRLFFFVSSFGCCLFFSFLPLNSYYLFFFWEGSSALDADALAGVALHVPVGSSLDIWAAVALWQENHRRMVQE